MPDHFDRLLTRYAPAAAAAGGPADGGNGRVRARPRLPGPFERVGAPGDGPLRQEETDPFLPAAPRPAAHREETRAAAPREREIRTEHRTVVRAESPARGEVPRPPAARPVRPLPRPARSTAPAPRPAAASGPRRDGPTAPARTEPEAPPRSAASAPLHPSADAALPPAGTGRLRPAASGASAAG
ncbi:hypothetical protein, partial [Streptomyces glaucosporus]|uniref:hypothetical protein n=1 Tax=Streptomyces glaucosporus TaxID=284044 RepID=UPI0031E33DB2